MARRDLPSPQEALRILSEKRTRPQRRPPPPLGRALNKTLKEFAARSPTVGQRAVNFRK